MNISKKAAHYLRDTDIDFSTFFIWDIAVQDANHAVVMLAPLYPREDKIFFAHYKGNKYPYGTIEKMMDIMVECRHLTRGYANRLIKKYYKILEEEL